MCCFQEKMFLICPYVLILRTAHGHLFMLCQTVLLPNINFLISKQNKTQKSDPKMLKHQAGIAIFRKVQSFTQTNKAYN